MCISRIHATGSLGGLLKFAVNFKIPENANSIAPTLLDLKLNVFIYHPSTICTTQTRGSARLFIPLTIILKESSALCPAAAYKEPIT